MVKKDLIGMRNKLNFTRLVKESKMNLSRLNTMPDFDAKEQKTKQKTTAQQ